MLMLALALITRPNCVYCVKLAAAASLTVDVRCPRCLFLGDEGVDIFMQVLVSL